MGRSRRKGAVLWPAGQSSNTFHIALPDDSRVQAEVQREHLQLQPLQHYFEVRKTLGQGLGLFARAPVPLGTVLPYVAVAMHCSSSLDEQRTDRHYCVHSTHLGGDGSNWAEQHTVPGLEMNGDPCLPQISDLPEGWSMASRINEAVTEAELNCEMTLNPLLRKADIEHSAAYSLPVICAYMVTTKQLQPGQQLLTVYTDAGDAEQEEYPRLHRSSMPESTLQWLTDVLHTMLHGDPSLHGQIHGPRPPFVHSAGQPPLTRAYYIFLK